MARSLPTPSVSVLIPSWNGLEHLKVVLPSLHAQTFQDYTVIVVDNGSDDGSAEYVRRSWPDVQLIVLPENRGFSGAVNAGIAQSQSEFIALLNNDLELDPEWLGYLEEALRNHPEAGAVGCKVLHYHDRERIDATAEQVSWYSTFQKRGHNELDRGQYDTPEWIWAPYAAAAVYRRELFEKVGSFDDDFFAYIEDSDLHWRAQLAGYKTWYEPRAKAYHLGGATSARISDFALYLWQRNLVWMIVKNYPLSRLVFKSHKILFAYAKTLLGGIRKKQLRILLRAWRDAFRKLPKKLAQRKRIQRNRKADVAYLDSLVLDYFTGPSRLLERFNRKRRNATPPGTTAPPPATPPSGQEHR